MNRLLLLQDRATLKTISGRPSGRTGAVLGAIRWVGRANGSTTRKAANRAAGGPIEQAGLASDLGQVGALPAVGFSGGDGQPQFFAHRAGQEATNGVGQPFRCGDDVLNGGTALTVQQREHLCGLRARRLLAMLWFRRRLGLLGCSSLRQRACGPVFGHKGLSGGLRGCCQLLGLLSSHCGSPWSLTFAVASFIALKAMERKLTARVRGGQRVTGETA